MWKKLNKNFFLEKFHKVSKFAKTVKKNISKKEKHGKILKSIHECL